MVAILRAVCLLIVFGTPITTYASCIPHNPEEVFGRDFRSIDIPPDSTGVMIGSSTIAYLGNKPELPHVGNAGVPGSQLVDAEHFLLDILPQHVAKIILYAGANDLMSGCTAEETSARLRALLDAIHTLRPQATLLYIGVNLPPVAEHLWEEMRYFNIMTGDMLTFNYPWVSFHKMSELMNERDEPIHSYFRDDGLHLSPSGEALLIRTIAEFLDRGAVAKIN